MKMTGSSDEEFIQELLEAMCKPLDPRDLELGRVGCFIIDKEKYGRALEAGTLSGLLYIPKDLNHGTTPTEPRAAEGNQLP